ncbi:acetoacetyl-CoA synthetase [Desulfocucumis palustris]|uniref:Acetoacetyl-CoA synthetase n=1 Tax=Desulfocucumis palustris TaxID=1898651 RepID=A0A2L2X7C6_9FIRM|nr:AMP-binding protein [Desulfocucumis palustris]GBF31978.1 acetoacetyl-CoA synthetase [Desulfocucumis palustris]
MKPFSKITIGQMLDKTVENNPDNDALVCIEFGLRYTYREFREECARLAKGLMALGINKEEHIAIWATNVPQWVITQFGSARMGAVLVTVNTNYKLFELEYLLKQSDSTTLLLIRGTKDADYIDMINQLCPELKDCQPGRLNSKRLPRLKNVIFLGDERYPGMYTWGDVLAAGGDVTDRQLAEREASIEPDDVVNMQYTSGTTGFPKGVMLTHTNLVGNATSIAECLNFRPGDRLCIPVPLFHCFGCVLGTLTCAVSGAAMALLEAFNPTRVLETIEAERCTAVHGVPTMFITELEVLNKHQYDVSTLRTGIMAGSPCPIEVMKQVVDRMGMKEIVITYGQTEAAPGITMTRTSDSIERRVSTVGKALPGVEVKVVDPVTGEEVPLGVQGEICARGYNVMKGYYKMPESSNAAIDREGWLHTGDLGIMDKEGYFRITGRIKDMIIRGGENIYPREVEEFLYTHPKIKDVQVVGVPSEKYGEEVMAFICLNQGEEATVEEIREFCTNKIARYKIPRFITFVNGYPTTASGKVQKYKLREQAIDDLGLQKAAVVETA